MYKILYIFGKQITKRDRYGVWKRVESLVVEILELTLAAAYSERIRKRPFLESARIKIEILKNIVRNCSEIDIIKDKQYLITLEILVTISKEVNNWIKFL